MLSCSQDLLGFNIRFNVNLTASNEGTCDSQVYQYSAESFYPINGQGFGNYYKHLNYGFTFAVNLRFNYQGTEKFSFAGDDDVFLFINGLLALDLGGVHSTETASLDLSYPSGGCPATFDVNNPPLPCVTASNSSKIPCACLLGLATGNGDIWNRNRFRKQLCLRLILQRTTHYCIRPGVLNLSYDHLWIF